MRAALGPGQLLEQLSRIVLDKEVQNRLVLTALIAGGHVLLEGLPGLGKTTLALARSLELPFARVQMTADIACRPRPPIPTGRAPPT